ncbi:hypothetical protein BKP44_18340 [Formosa algae]|nr:hypothetical protein BKP44_18340 [Formosa algae]
MDTIIGILMLIIIITMFYFIIKQVSFPKHDFSGDLEKEKESYGYTISKLHGFINDIKSLFRK